MQLFTAVIHSLIDCAINQGPTYGASRIENDPMYIDFRTLRYKGDQKSMHEGGYYAW